jgi:hypothetical protein
MFFQWVTLFRRLLRHSVPRNDKLVFQKSGEDSGGSFLDIACFLNIICNANADFEWQGGFKKTDWSYLNI